MLVLLQKALDPPDPDVVQHALDLLVLMGALKTSPRKRFEPTFYGRLLACFSRSFDASLFIIKFGEVGLLYECILIGVLMDTQPLPIVHPFGLENLVLPIKQMQISIIDPSTGKKTLLLLAIPPFFLVQTAHKLLLQWRY